MPTISVIIPVYNVEKYLRECLDSVLAQTFADFEVLLVDDGATDASPEICEEYADLDSRIRVFHQKNAGQAAARNFAVSLARAEWIAFVDSDDVIHPQYLELLYEGITKHQVRISVCGYMKGMELPEDFCEKSFDPVSELRELDEKCYFNTKLQEDNLLDNVVWRMIAAKDIVQQYPFAKGRIHEDTAVVCYWLMCAGKIAFSETPLYFYRENPAGTMLRAKYDVKHIDELWANNRQLDCWKGQGFDAMVKYYGMWGLLTCADFYQAYKTTVPDKKAAGLVRKEFCEMEKKCGGLDCLSEDERDWVAAMFHPVKFYLRTFQGKCREYGISGVLKKCFERIFGGG